VLYPDLFIIGANVPGVMKYNLITKEKTQYKIDKSFQGSAMISRSTIALKGFDTVSNDQIFRKINLITGQISRENNITELLRDAGIATSGIINYDSILNTLTFVHFFNNKIYRLDTNLNLIGKGKTIDTLSSYQARGKGITVNGETSFSYAYPPRVVNLYNYTYEGKIYNYSQVMADNQTNEDYLSNAMIDVYDVKTNRYLGSFTLPKENGKKLHKFIVYKNLFVALYGKKLVTYRLKYLLQ